MILNKDEHEGMMEMISVRAAFPEPYEDGGFKYFCTKSGGDTISCQFSAGGKNFNVTYNTWTAVLEADAVCDEESWAFIDHLRNKYFSVVDRSCIKEHPEDAYYEIDGQIIRMSNERPALRGIYPDAAGDTMIWGGDIPWRH